MRISDWSSDVCSSDLAPDIILGSWCGKKFRPEKVAARPGWDAIPAVRDGQLHEIKSPIILQPGPAALTDGVREIDRIVQAWAQRPAEVGVPSSAHANSPSCVGAHSEIGRAQCREGVGKYGKILGGAGTLK